MPRYGLRNYRLGLYLLLLVFPQQNLAQEIQFQTAKLDDGKELQFAVVLPEDFDSNKKYPALLALPPGPQTKAMVKAGFQKYWNAAKNKGWIVVSPIANGKKLFHSGSEGLIPQFLVEIQKTYQPAGGKFHLAGVSNGGRSAFRIACQFPKHFHSLMVLPGIPTPEDEQRLDKINHLSIAMYVGGDDKQWIAGMEKTVASLKKLKADVTFEIVPGQGHVIAGWEDGKKLFTVLNSWHKQVVSPVVEK